MHLSFKSRLVNLSDAEQAAQRAVLDRGNNFISNEVLAHLDPAFWEANAEKNLRAFGPDTIILITFREAYSFLRSVYQQHVQGGNVVRPEFFFVDEETYLRSKRLRAEFRTDYFCTDYMNYEDLVSFYTSRFARVVCVDLKNIGRFDFLDGVVSLTEAEKQALVTAFERAPKRNKSYSSAAMKLTFWRERVLNAMGMKSFGTSDWRYEKLLPGFGDWGDEDLAAPNKTLSRKGKIIQVPKRALKRVVRWLGVSSWTELMHRRLGLFVRYKPYDLPINSLRINRDNMDKCNAFLERLNAGTATVDAPKPDPGRLRQN